MGPFWGIGGFHHRGVKSKEVCADMREFHDADFGGTGFGEIMCASPLVGDARHRVLVVPRLGRPQAPDSLSLGDAYHRVLVVP